MEQLELESRGAGAVSRLAAYRAELQRVREEYRSVLNSSATCIFFYYYVYFNLTYIVKNCFAIFSHQGLLQYVNKEVYSF